MMTTDLPAPPSYFSRDAQINLEGPALLNPLQPKCLDAGWRLRNSSSLAPLCWTRVRPRRTEPGTFPVRCRSACPASSLRGQERS